jgi:hypothetical protein
MFIPVNPLFAFSFLDTFLETLRDYLGEVTESALKDNFDIVYMVRQFFIPRQLITKRTLTHSLSRRC